MVPGSALNWIAVNTVQQSILNRKLDNMTTLNLRKSSGRSPLRLGLPRVQRIWIIRGLLLIPLALAWFGLSPQARAACQDGCGLIIGNTFLGEDALVHNTSPGANNTAIGKETLY